MQRLLGVQGKGTLRRVRTERMRKQSFKSTVSGGEQRSLSRKGKEGANQQMRGLILASIAK